MRQVFKTCDSGTAAGLLSSRVQDLEPKAVHVDQDDVAYVLFSVSLFHSSLELLDVFSLYHSG